MRNIGSQAVDYLAIGITSGAGGKTVVEKARDRPARRSDIAAGGAKGTVPFSWRPATKSGQSPALRPLPHHPCVAKPRGASAGAIFSELPEIFHLETPRDRSMFSGSDRRPLQRFFGRKMDQPPTLHVSRPFSLTGL